MKKIVCVLILLTVSLSLFSASNEGVTPEYLVEVMQNAGYEAKVDQDGDVEFLDQYEMYYWITCSPAEGRLYIQSGWPAAIGVSSEKAYKIVNESNSRFYLIRTFYDSAYRTFYCDYDFYYPDIFDEALFLKVIENFLSFSDVFTDYLIGEEVI
ncbi:MAG TPA: hypothetical protein IAA76_00490 [Candidatus Ornithospirochaeta stercorigallinarum]|nr:hypothetical protein [Candidatus Ornithospirochaeta stercorigallinarum]